MKIPLGKPYIKTEVALEAIKEVLDSRWISGGPKINEFEEKIKEYNNDSEGHYIAVSNGTVAIELALLAINKGKRLTENDEVIVPSWSWVASVFAVSNFIPTEYISTVTCLISLGCGIIGSVELFLQIQQQMESDFEQRT